MSSIYLSDSGTPILGRAERLIQEGTIEGVILTPFASPQVPMPGQRGGRARQDAARCVEVLGQMGATLFFDAQTHALDFPGANAFSKYDQWQLWNGPRGDHSLASSRQSHVERVLAAQQALGVPGLSPTVRLDSPGGVRGHIAQDYARRTLLKDRNAWLTIAGASSFWEGGHALDAYIGVLAELQPAGFLVVVTRALVACPAQGVSAAEVEGLCRTVYSLSIRCPVIVSHGDFAALPAIAAGATGIGSGWDLRQRVLAAEAFHTSTTRRRRGSRVTYRGLLAVLRRAEAERLLALDAARSDRLVPGRLPIDQVGEWEHHLRTLAALTAALSLIPSPQQRVVELQSLYGDAAQEFAIVERLARPQHGAAEWLGPVSQGLDLCALAEGW